VHHTPYALHRGCLFDLLLWLVELSLLNKTLNARLEGKMIDDATLGDLALEWGKGSANSKDYEYWSAIFSLYEDFGEGSETCFYLKDTFNHQTRSSRRDNKK